MQRINFKRLYSLRYQLAGGASATGSSGGVPNINQSQTQSGTNDTTGFSSTNNAQQATSNTSATGQSAQQGTANTANQYTAGQQSLQSLLPNLLQSFVTTGNLPGSFSDPSQVNAAYQQNFNSNVAPQLAAQYGAGSPQLAAQNTAGLTNLMSSLYQNQSNNFSNVLGQLGTTAFTPTGTNSTNSSTGTNSSNTASTGNQTGQSFTQGASLNNFLTSLLSSIT